MYKIHTRDFHQQNPSTLSYIECRCLKSIGVWAGGHGGGARAPPQFLRSGKNQCEIRAKHKSFGKISIRPEKIFVSLRKLRDVRKNVLICPPKFSYVCTRKVSAMSGNFFWYVRKNILVNQNSPPLANNFGEKY